MTDHNIYNLRDSEIRRFLEDVGKDPSAFQYLDLDDLCRDIMVMTGNFFKPTGFAELCDDYGVIAFSKDISEQAMTDALLAVKNPDAIKKMNKYYPPYSIFLHMTSTVFNHRADPTSLFDPDIVKKIWGIAAALYKMAGISSDVGISWDAIINDIMMPELEPLIKELQKLDNTVYVTPFGIVLLENTNIDSIVETTTSVIRFTKNGKYTYAGSGKIKIINGKVVPSVADIPRGKNHELQKTHLNAKAFPRSFACVSAYHTFVASYGMKITKKQSLMAHQFSRVLNDIFTINSCGEQRSTYITIDLSVPNVIVLLLLFTVSTHYILGNEYTES